MGRSKVELSEIVERLRDSNKTIAEIADELGLHRVGLYERIRKSGIEIGQRRAGRYEAKLPRYPLEHLYLKERLTIAQIGARLGLSPGQVASEIRAHGLTRGRGEARRKRPAVARMKVGDSFDIAFAGAIMPS